MRKFDLVDKDCYSIDAYNAPFETIIAETRNIAKYQYIKLHTETKYVNVLCRKSRIGSYNY